MKEKVRRGINARIDYLNSSIASEVKFTHDFLVVKLPQLCCSYRSGRRWLGYTTFGSADMAVTNHSEGSRTRHTSHTPNRTIRLYGIPLLISGGTKTDTEEPHGTALGIVYCGFKADGNELRVPTGRVFSLRKDQVTESGEVADYVVSGETVYYYDVPFTAEVRESDSRRISLATEVITTTGGTFAGLVATPPIHTPMDLSTLEALSREELLAQIRFMRTQDV